MIQTQIPSIRKANTVHQDQKQELPLFLRRWQLFLGTEEGALGDPVWAGQLAACGFVEAAGLRAGNTPRLEVDPATSKKWASLSSHRFWMEEKLQFEVFSFFCLVLSGNPRAPASYNRKCFIIIFFFSSLTNLNVCIFKKKREKTGTFEEINATQHWQNLMNNLTLLSLEKLGLSSGKHSLFIFWKVLFDRPFAVDVTVTKHAVTGLFEYGDRLIIMLKTPDNTAVGKWTGLPISCWKDCGWNRVFCSKNSGTNWLH